MTPKITRMLLAINLSRNSVHALDQAVYLAEMTGAEIRIVHVLEGLSEDAKMTMMMFIQDSKARTQAMNSRLDLARESLMNWHDEFWGSQPEERRKLRDHVGSVEVVEGFPAGAILSEARRQACDLIVMGAHEHGFSHTFLGTVATRVLRRAEVPTLIVPYRDGD